MAFDLPDLDWSQAQGIRPRLRFCVGSGYSREELKAFLFARGVSFVGAAVSDPVGLAAQIAGVKPPLNPTSRQEVLKYLLSLRVISSRFPELGRLKRKAGFFARLDRAIQSGRMAYAHEQEREVMEERLRSLWPDESPVRQEVHALAAAYEAWMESKSLKDDVGVYRVAIEALSSNAVNLDLPEDLVVFHTNAMESLERTFWDTLMQKVPQIHWVTPVNQTPEVTSEKLHWQHWHTLDDAVEELLNSMDPHRDVILIPDEPSVRRTLQRALSERHWVLEDPRDPMLLRTGEEFKRALSPLQVVASDYASQEVVAWVGSGVMAREIAQRGVHQGLESYRGGALEPLYQELVFWRNHIGKKGTVTQMAAGHLEILEKMEHPEVEFFASQWMTYIEDLIHLNQDKRQAPARFWIEGFLNRYRDATPPVKKLKPETGLRVYRLTQQALLPWSKLWVFGMPSGWISQNEVRGDYWYSARDREILGAEFDVLSSHRKRDAKLSNLRLWCQKSKQVTFLSAEYGEDGQELESIAADLRALGWTEPSCEEKGGHPRWLPSYSAVRPVPPQVVQLVASEKHEIRATDLDRYSRCAFQGLSYVRWRLQDGRDAEMDLWPDVRGRILHTAVKMILERGLDLSPERAVSEAWKNEKIRGWISNPYLEKFQKRKMENVLSAFVEAEKKYRDRSGCTVMSLEGPPLEWIEEGIRIYGIPDRIDRHPDGLWIIDFKTEADLPQGDEMVEQGYRLQLPAYALAAQSQLEEPVLGVQFIRLREGAERHPGIFPKKYNGKTPGSIVETRARRSLLEMEPVEIWERTRENVLSHARDYFSGKFSPVPKRGEKECLVCHVRDLCGRRRILSESDAEESES